MDQTQTGELVSQVRFRVGREPGPGARLLNRLGPIVKVLRASLPELHQICLVFHKRRLNFHVDPRGVLRVDLEGLNSRLPGNGIFAKLMHVDRLKIEVPGKSRSPQVLFHLVKVRYTVFGDIS